MIFYFSYFKKRIRGETYETKKSNLKGAKKVIYLFI